jgi:type I restriction enzyme S subunit
VEVKPGYKQTEAGVIPEDWAIVELGNLSEFITSGSRGWARYYSDRGALFVRSQNVRAGQLDLTDSQFVNPPQGSEGSRTRVKHSDLLITITGNSVGNVALVEQELGEAYISQHVGLVRLREPSRGHYVCRFLSPGSPGNGQISASQSGQSKPGLTLKDLQDFWIALPPIPEQRAIAWAMSDVDELIGALEQLIAKKRDLKQAAMQQLLTGQKRLPGFHGEWEVKKLGEVGRFAKGKGIKKDEVVAEGAPCIRYGEIYTHHHDYIRQFRSFIPRSIAEQSQRLQKGDLLFAGSGETAEEIGKCVAFLGDEEAYAGGDIVILTPTGHNSMYLGYLMNHASIVEQKARMGQGDAVVHVSARHLAQLNVRLPKDSEQTAIAEVLSDMDAELAALEQRRDKTRALKQGMMQELLTGRTRLV